MDSAFYPVATLAGNQGPGSEWRSIHALFEVQVGKTPDEAAISYGGETVTYRELDSRANALAQRLSDVSVEPDKLVGIFLDRSIEMVVALVATLKAGGAYVYLDPAYPSDRLGFILSDAEPSAVVTRTRLTPELPAGSARVLCVDEETPKAAAQDGHWESRRVEPHHLAYLIYTSGSTGLPKGVAMPHGALRNLLEWQLDEWESRGPARTLQFTSLNFDVSFQEIFSTLCGGGTLVLTSEEERRDPYALLRLMRDQSVERIFLPFVALQQLAASFEAERIVPQKLRDVVTAGEQLQITPQVRTFFENLPGCTLHNQYGPAESHIIVTTLALRGDRSAWPLLPSIGLPIARARIHILDDRKRPVPPGEAGELYIGGDALARGYWKRGDLTAERFLPDPFTEEPGARLYSTGDLARLLPSGDIQFLGRGDQQVKIRGVRVEPGEVEAVMAQHPSVVQAAVCATERQVGDKRLVAYFVPRTPSGATAAQLRRFLETKLPSQFVPSSFVPVPAMPLTASGKIDRRALLATGEGEEWTADESASTVTAEPGEGMSGLEARLIGIWEHLLRKRPIGLRDNFFDLGGDSLLAVQICMKVRTQFGKRLSVASLFEAPTVQELAHVIEGERPSGEGSNMKPSAPMSHPSLQPPLFCMPEMAAFGEEFARERPVYGFELSSLLAAMEPIEDPEAAVPRIAGQWVGEIRAVQPHGPYHLVGHSFGAVVAFEAALRLLALGEEVALLALLDPDPPKRTFLAAALSAFVLPVHLLRRLFSLRGNTWTGYLAGRANKRKEHLASKIEAKRAFAEMDAWRKLDALNGTYMAKKFPGRILLCCARDGEKPVGRPRALEWESFAAGGAEVHEIPGDHMGMLIKPNVETLARALRSFCRLC